MKPTPEQIAQEITALKLLKPIGPWKAKTTAAIELVVRVLEHGFDETSDEWDELSSEQQDSIIQTEGWKDGGIPDKPSEGWSGLVE